MKLITPRPGQESVWDYPRPPRLEPCSKSIIVKFAGVELVRTTRSVRLLETSHPPTYYLPPDDIRWEFLAPGNHGSFCEFKGHAVYWHVRVGTRTVDNVGWSYPNPSSDYAALRDHIAFYAGLVDECIVDGNKVQPQPGGFYGGWITPEILGPFKGGPGTLGW
jgi:uncharacterized protein (DUF427 family)